MEEDSIQYRKYKPFLEIWIIIALMQKQMLKVEGNSLAWWVKQICVNETRICTSTSHGG
jgi:hypothetical protein